MLFVVRQQSVCADIMAYSYPKRYITEHALQCSSASDSERETLSERETFSADSVDRESGCQSENSFAAVEEFSSSSYEPTDVEEAYTSDENDSNTTDFSCGSGDTLYSSTEAFAQAYNAAKNKDERAKVVGQQWRYFKDGDEIVCYTFKYVQSFLIFCTSYSQKFTANSELLIELRIRGQHTSLDQISRSWRRSGGPCQSQSARPVAITKTIQ